MRSKSPVACANKADIKTDRPDSSRTPLRTRKLAAAGPRSSNAWANCSGLLANDDAICFSVAAKAALLEPTMSSSAHWRCCATVTCDVDALNAVTPPPPAGKPLASVAPGGVLTIPDIKLVACTGASRDWPFAVTNIAVLQTRYGRG